MKGRKPSLETIRKRLAGAYDGPPPVCPDWLDAGGKAEWDRVVPLLTELGLAYAIDTAALAGYCHTYSSWVQVETAIRLEGRVVGTARGDIKLHPLARHSAQLLAQLTKLAQEFGFTPAARARVETPPKPNQEEDAFDSFLASTNGKR